MPVSEFSVARDHRSERRQLGIPPACRGNFEARDAQDLMRSRFALAQSENDTANFAGADVLTRVPPQLFGVLDVRPKTPGLIRARHAKSCLLPVSGRLRAIDINPRRVLERVQSERSSNSSHVFVRPQSYSTAGMLSS